MQWFRLSMVLAVLTTSVVLVGRTSGDMILYFSFNEGEGEKVSNELGSGNNGTAHDTKWVDGKYGKALQFNGQSSYVLVPNFSPLNMTTQFTVEAWVKWAKFVSDTSGFAMISKSDYANNGYMLYQSTGSPYNRVSYFIFTDSLLKIFKILSIFLWLFWSCNWI